MPKWILAASFLLLLLSGCSGVGARRQAYLDAHPNLLPEVAEAIREGMVVKGMRTDDVRASWGDPEHQTVTVTEGGIQEVWSYPTPVGQFVVGKVILNFSNGLLVKLIN